MNFWLNNKPPIPFTPPSNKPKPLNKGTCVEGVRKRQPNAIKLRIPPFEKGGLGGILNY
jgi:hypothetical protein